MVPPHRSIIGSTVSGTVDADYLAAWLTDGSPGYPAKTTGDLSLTATPAAALLVDVAAVCHHTIESGATVTLGGSLSGTIDTQAWPPDDIPTNWYRLLETPVLASSIALGVSGNANPVIVGEFYAGLSTLFPRLTLGRRLAPGAMFPWEGEFSSLAPYDPGVHRPLRVSGKATFTETQLNELDACYLSQRNGSRPVLILPDYPVDAAWLCQFSYTAEDFVPGEPPGGSPPSEMPDALFTVTLDIVEIPRLRW